MAINSKLSAPDELPEFFVHYLQQYHGIDLNAPPKTLKETWIKLWYTNDYIFNEVNRWYGKIRDRIKDSQRALEWDEKNLQRMWGISLDINIDLCELHSNDWSAPFKAITTLKKVYQQLPTAEEINAQKTELDLQERIKWIEDLLKTAREQNATFVVIKDKNFTPTYQENIDSFNNSVAQRQSCVIWLMCIAPMWLACKVDELETSIKQGLCLSRNECSVEFFTDI